MAGHDRDCAVVMVWLIACTTSPTPPVPKAPVPPHFARWPTLLVRVARVEFEAAGGLARSLSIGVVGDEHPAAARVGGALGFIQVASTAEELRLGVRKASEACADCHRASGVQVPPSPSAEGHEAPLTAAGWQALWTEGANLDDALAQCQSCHSG